MPEGDTVHKIAAVIAPLLEGERLCEAHAARSRLPLLEGSLVHAVAAVGKHLLVDCGAWVLRVHLGMHGDWHRYAPGEPWRRPAWQASVHLASPRHVVVCFNAQEVDCLRQHELPSSIVGSLGPDLLAPTCDLQAVVQRARRLLPDSPMVDVLLNQRVAAGLGNVYKSELLYLHRVAPMRHVQSLSAEVLLALFADGRRLLQANLGGWMRTTTYDRRHGPQPQARLHVYGRIGEPCPTCSTPIVRQRLGRHRRSTYWCPCCQL